MKLVGELKEKAEETSNISEANQAIEIDAMESTDEEMEEVAGGIGRISDPDYMQALQNVRQLHQKMREATSKSQADSILREILFGSYKGYSYKDIAISRGFL